MGVRNTRVFVTPPSAKVTNLSTGSPRPDPEDSSKWFQDDHAVLAARKDHSRCEAEEGLREQWKQVRGSP